MERSPFPEKLVSWTDIAKGAGEVALQTIVRFVRHVTTEPTDAHSEHFKKDKDEQLSFVYECDGGDLPREDGL